MIVITYRYIVIDYEWVAADGRKISKLSMIAYAPDDGCEKAEKVAYSMNIASVKNDCQKQFADARCINSFEDLTAENIQSWYKE